MINLNINNTRFRMLDFGFRGTGKAACLKNNFPKSVYINLLKSETFNKLLAQSGRLENLIPKDFADWVILDEVQRIPSGRFAYRLPSFTKKAKRKNVRHSKFYFFDVGVYRAIRPKGPFDLPEEIEGISLETYVFQELRAMNEYHDLKYTLYFCQYLISISDN